MAESFYTIITSVGKAKMANACALGTRVNLTNFAVGDGNGTYYTPTEELTELNHEVWRSSIRKITMDEANSNWIVIEAIIPAKEGGFTIREAAIFDDTGSMIAIGKYPETYKPAISEGSSKDLYIRMILEVSNANSVSLKVDPNIIVATKRM